MNTRTLLRKLLQTTIGLSAVGLAQAQLILPERPEPGSLHTYNLRLQRVQDGLDLRADYLAVDQGEAVHESEVWLSARGDAGRGDRTLRISRFDADCLQLAKQSILSAQAFCDRIAVSEQRGLANIQFKSHDADRAYGFQLVDQGDGRWQSRAQGDLPEPALSLQLADGRYAWQLEGSRQVHQQSGSIDRELQRELGYSDLEWAGIGLAELLRDFNSEEFRYSVLPRDHEDYQYSPYLAWGGGEEGLDGGCIFLVCFGDIGGGTGGGGDGGGLCDPDSEYYNPELCPADLSYATWPISQRVKIWKINNDQFAFSLFIKNVGTGNYYLPLMNIGDDAFSIMLHVTLTAGSQPLVPKNTLSIYDFKCFYQKSVMTLPNPNPLSNDPLLPPGGTLGVTRTVNCPKSSGRPDDWYRLWFQIDPWSQGYDPGPSSNNTGNSGAFDWIKLK